MKLPNTKSLRPVLLLAFMLAITAAKAQWSKASGIEGGKVNTIAPKGNTLFAGTDTGGIFISTDFGRNWIPGNTGLTNKQVKALMAKDSVMIAGVYGFGGAVFISKNNGASWAEPTGQYFGFLFCFAEGGSDVFAGTWYGVAKSSDKGDNWATLANTGLPSNASVSAMLESHSFIFAGVSGSSTGGEGMFRSANNGNNWTIKNTGITNTNFTAMAKGDSVIYVATNGGGIFRSADDGENWGPVNNGLTNLFVNTLYIKGNAMLAGTKNGIFLSRTGGANWTDVSAGLPAGTNVQSITTAGPHLVLGTDTSVWFRRTAEIITSVLPLPYSAPTVNVYPNPTSGNFTVEIPAGIENAEVSVINTLGEVIYQTKHSQAYLPVDIGNEARGIYYVRLKTGNETIYRRVIMQ